MKKRIAVGLLIFALITSTTYVLHAWGFWAHKRINHLAVFTLPDPLKKFYEKHIDSITEHAIDPDLRRKDDKEEGARHFIDADYYGKTPFTTLPLQWTDAVKKYTADTLKKYGINPWHVNELTSKLTEAFKAHDVKKIISLSADLGHYVADAHVPLHATMNYDGQMTNQKGIHAFWEARVPEMFGNTYNYYPGQATYLANVQEEAWKILRVSFSEKDSVLLLEKGLNDTFPKDKKYIISIDKNGKEVKQYTDAYTRQYSMLLHGMVERRMRDAIKAVGSFWYTAWVNAGKPDMDKWDTTTLSQDQSKALQDEETRWKKGVPLEK